MCAAAKLAVPQVTTRFRALGNETQIRIVALLTHGELCVCLCLIQSTLKLPQPTASRHMGILFQAGIVTRRREASWVYFKLAEPTDAATRQQLKALCKSFSGVAALRKDVEALLKNKGPDSCK